MLTLPAVEAPATDRAWHDCRFLTCSVLPVRVACNLRCPFCFSKSSVSALRQERADWQRLDVESYYRFARERGATRLVITGAVHISQALGPIAQLLGYDVTIVDPRTAFATGQRFPDVVVIADWPDAVLPALNIDHYTAFVALTHDPKIDDPALVHVLARDCFYVGALGSKKTHARRLARLREQGVSDAALSRISAPIGLAIGAASPAEIAVAIMAQITAHLRLEQEVAG